MRRALIATMIFISLVGCTALCPSCFPESCRANGFHGSECNIGPDIGQYLPGGRSYTPSNTETIFVRRVAPNVTDYDGPSGTVRVWQTP